MNSNARDSKASEGTLSEEEVAKIVRLSSLEVEREDLSLMTKEFNEILGYVRKLQSVDVEGIEPMSHVNTGTNVFREDATRPSLSIEEGMRNAPDRVGSFIRVPLVVEG